MSKMKVAIIGAGLSGLCAAKHALDNKCEVSVFERTTRIGGTWVYTDQIGTDEFGLPIHTSMYKGLTTNLPVEAMGFPEFPFPNKGKSFVSNEEVLEFIDSYAREFKLNDVVKLAHNVVNVIPIADSRWQVTVKNLRDNTYHEDIYNAIFICNGHYFKPYWPTIDDWKLYKGRSIHSHDYRRPNIFQDERVLIIGGGPSGKDIIYEVAKFAKSATISHHRDMSHNILPENVNQKGDIKRFTENGVVFVDGTEETYATVLFCTGYQFSFPFLSLDCGLNLDEGFHVFPLYKHLININYPTMAIVGLQICAYTYMYDMQVRLCLKYWSGEKSMPTKEHMLEDMQKDTKKQFAKSDQKRRFHFLNIDQTDYFHQLALVGDMPVPELIIQIYEDCNTLRIAHANDYRDFVYKIVDNQTFTRTKLTVNGET